MLPFREAWCTDFEFQGGRGERPRPVCMVAQEYFSGRELRLWQDDLEARTSAPFPVDRLALFVAYYASAELGCFRALGWPPPAAVLDLYVEFRAETNGLPTPAGSGLLGALAYHGLDSMSAETKDEMRDLVLRGGPWSAAERQAISDYCALDTRALTTLLPKMLPAVLMRGDTPRQGLGQALLRGRFMQAAAQMEWAGVPVDRDLLAQLRTNWDGLKAAVVAEVADTFPVFDGTTFKHDKFAAYLAKNEILWPRLKSGRLDLADDIFREMARVYPRAIAPIREVRTTLSELRLHELEVGSDGRNRCLLSAFRARSSRNQPSNNKFVFGPAVWLRSLITPAPGRALAYVDFVAQEIAIAAALSGDDNLWCDYLTDPYLGFGKRAGIVPENATKATHREARDRLKAVVLGVGYGMTEFGLASRLGVPLAEARQLLRAHRRAYGAFWAWSDAFVASAQLTGRAMSCMGWPLAVRASDNPRSLRNFPMQAGGAEMLRLACIFATEAGLSICAPIHDALLLEAGADEIDERVLELQEHMARASEIILGRGRRCRSDAGIVRPGERYEDERGALMFRRITGLLNKGGPRRPVCELDAAEAALLVPQEPHRSLSLYPT